ncbi:MAG TPA: PepSY domain-containing protein [Devosia sp.]|nr:PepSY domain-containing protein [Devosia sp.]
MRRFHSFAGLAGALLVTFMATTGFVLSLQPIVDSVTTATSARSGVSVAAVADGVAQHLPGVERLVRSASGQLVAYAMHDGGHVAVVVDPQTGAATGAYAPSAFFTFVTDLHRSFLLGSSGHVMAGLSALAILALAVSGMLLLVAKMGGWRKLFAGSRGTGSQRLHTDLARIGVVMLLLTAMTGAYMSGVSFELLPESGAEAFAFAPTSAGETIAPIASLEALASVPLSDLRELAFPVAGDASDVFTLTTNAGRGYVDQGTGAMLEFAPNDAWRQAYEFVYLLHTGQGAPLVALLVGLGALTVPLLAVTGSFIWWTRRRNTPRIAHNAPWRDADTIVLVGSEAGSTWGFAATLHDALAQHGLRVHVAAMNDLRRSYPKATRLIVLAATYGDGAAPASARQFLAKLERFASTPAFSVLGFGDQSFARFCGFAAEVDAALEAKGLRRLAPQWGVDRQSAGQFAAWGRLLGEQLGRNLVLNHVPKLPKTGKLVLAERVLYGTEVQAPVVILRFAAPQSSRRWFGGRLPRFDVGDLVGIIPPGSDLPRYYSLASTSRDGLLEICVRKQAGGLCSEFLHSLSSGDAVDAFIRPNPDFRPAGGRRPLILIGAGAGVAPLAGFVRHNRNSRPVHLFFGGRDPASDFLYRDDLEAALDDGRLASLNTTFSRVLGGGYVQALLVDEAETIRRLVRQGAQIMVCGGRDMANGVREAIDLCIAPLGLSADMLKQKGSYLEDAY